MQLKYYFKFALKRNLSDTENKNISLEQVIFSGFKGVNTFKKSELETQKASLKLKQKEQQIIFETAFAYFDYIFKSNNEKFNFSNVNLFERQVEFDNARLQKGEITLTDLAQSESSLAGANANLIKAKTELLSSITNFERIIGEKVPSFEDLNQIAVKSKTLMYMKMCSKYNKLLIDQCKTGFISVL